MKRLKRFLLGTVLLLSASPLLFAEELVSSLVMKQYEIEQSIRSSLSSHLQPKDYVVRVQLEGIPAGAKEPPLFDQDEALPGFEPERSENKGFTENSPTENTGPWKISKVRVNFVLYKLVSPSFEKYLSEIIPLLSGMVPGRGDEFRFIPIPPMESTIATPAADFSTAEKSNAPATVTTPSIPQPPKEPSESSNWQPNSPQEWGWLLLGFAILLGLAGLMWKLRRLQQSLAKPALPVNPYPTVQATEPPLSYALVQLDQARQHQQEQQRQMELLILRDDNSRNLQEVIKHFIGRADWTEQFLKEMRQDKASTEKLTQLMSILGLQTARKLFASILGPQEYLLLEQMAKGLQLDPAQTNEVILEVRNLLFAKALSVPEEHHSNPFSFLEKLTPDQIHFLIDEEPLKIKAIVLSRLDSETATYVLQKLTKEDRSQVVVQLGHLQSIPLELIEKVAYSLAEKGKTIPDHQTVAFNGVHLLVDVMEQSDSETRQEMMNHLRTSDQKLSHEIESRLFLFESIPMVPREVLTDVVRQQNPSDVILAIIGASSELQRCVILCFPENVRQTLVASLKSQTADALLIQSKRQLMVRALQKLGVTKKLNLKEVYDAWNQRLLTAPSPLSEIETL